MQQYVALETDTNISETKVPHTSEMLAPAYQTTYSHTPHSYCNLHTLGHSNLTMEMNNQLHILPLKLTRQSKWNALYMKVSGPKGFFWV